MFSKAQEPSTRWQMTWHQGGRNARHGSRSRAKEIRGPSQRRSLGAIGAKSPSGRSVAQGIGNQACALIEVRRAAFGFKKRIGGLDVVLWMVARLGGIMSWRRSWLWKIHRGRPTFDMQGQLFQAFVEDLSWCLTLVGFRREPIYLSDEALREPGWECYLQAVDDVPELARLRTLYKGRVAHTDGGSWVEKILEAAGKQPPGGR